MTLGYTIPISSEQFTLGGFNSVTETYSIPVEQNGGGGNTNDVPSQDINVSATVVQPQPPPSPPPTATSWGDVHMITFDGLTYNFQAAGEFVLAESTVAGDSYQIQIRTAPWSSGATVSVITEIAAAVGQDRVTFGLNRTDVVWIDGVPEALQIGTATSIGNGAGTLVQESSSTYKLTWATGEVLNVTDNGTYFSLTTALAPGSGPGSVEGLLGSDSGQANDFQLADGTVLAQPLSSAQLYGEFADAWRVPAGTQGLFDYGPDETTDNYTDVNFPSDAVSLSQLPESVVLAAQQAVQAAGITDPGLAQDAELDLIVTGNLGALSAAQNPQQSGVITTQAQITGAAAPAPAAGVTAAQETQVESGGGVTTVDFTTYLTQAVSTDTAMAYSVVASSADDLGYSADSLAAFGGTLPTGTVTIAAGQTSAQFALDVPNAALGLVPSATLDVEITAPSDVPVFAPDAQTVLINGQPVPGNAADPLVYEVSNQGTWKENSGGYTLDLGNVRRGRDGANSARYRQWGQRAGRRTSPATSRTPEPAGSLSPAAARQDNPTKVFTSTRTQRRSARRPIRSPSIRLTRTILGIVPHRPLSVSQ